MANIELDVANKKIKVDSGDLTLDIPGDIILDADGGDITFADGGTNLLKVTNSSSDVVFQPQVDTKDIVFKQYDGTVVATVEDNATFNVPTGKLAINGTAITSTAAEINLIDGGTARGTTAIADGDGVLINDAGTMRMTSVDTLKTYIGGFDVTSITGATALATQPASTDEIVLSDAGTLKRLDIKHIQNTPAFAVYKNADQSLSDGVHTKVAFNTEVYDTDSAYDNSTNYRFTPAVAGKYFLTTSIAAKQSNDESKMHNLIISLYKNGSQVSSSNSFSQASSTFSVTHTDTIDLDDDDYVEVFAFAQVQTETPVLESDTTVDGSRALGRALTFSGFRITGV